MTRSRKVEEAAQLVLAASKKPELESQATEAAIATCDGSEKLALLALWGALRSTRAPFVDRILSFLVGKPRGAAGELWEVVALDLVSPPLPGDTSTMLNLLSAYQFPPSATEEAILFYYGFPRFVTQCLTSATVVRDAALATLARVIERPFDGFRFGPGFAPAAQAVSSLSSTFAEDDELLRSDAGLVARHLVHDSVRVSVARYDVAMRHASVALNERIRSRQLPPELERYASSTVARFVLLATTWEESATSSRPIQLLRIDHGGKQLDLKALTSIADRWRHLFVAACDAAGRTVQLLPLASAPGSFVLKLVITGDETPPAVADSASVCKSTFLDLSRVLEVVQGPAAGRPALDLSTVGEPRAVLELLDAVATSGCEVHVEVVDPADPSGVPTIRLIPAVARRARRNLQREVGESIDSSDVPQADSLVRVVDVVGRLVDGEELDPAQIEISLRQVNYYRHAGRVLGLLDAENRPTPVGRLMVKLDDRRRKQLLAVLFEASKCGASWVVWSGVPTLAQVDPTSAEAYLAAVVQGLNLVTIGRRAQTLEAWWHEIAQFHYAWNGERSDRR